MSAVERIAMETDAWVDTVAEGEKYLLAHPSHQGAAPISHQTEASQQSTATVRDGSDYIAYKVTQTYRYKLILRHLCVRNKR